MKIQLICGGFCTFASLFLMVSCQNTSHTDRNAAAFTTPKHANMAWHCLGTEPFWSVEISDNGTAIVETPEKKEAPIALTAIAETAEAAAYSGENLQIRIKKEKCSDGMSETVYLYSAEVDYDIYAFKGCANKK